MASVSPLIFFLLSFSSSFFSLSIFPISFISLVLWTPGGKSHISFNLSFLIYLISREIFNIFSYYAKSLFYSHYSEFLHFHLSVFFSRFPASFFMIIVHLFMTASLSWWAAWVSWSSWQPGFRSDVLKCSPSDFLLWGLSPLARLSGVIHGSWWSQYHRLFMWWFCASSSVNWLSANIYPLHCHSAVCFSWDDTAANLP